MNILVEKSIDKLFYKIIKQNDKEYIQADLFFGNVSKLSIKIYKTPYTILSDVTFIVTQELLTLSILISKIIM